MSRQAFSHPNEAGPRWSGVVPFALAITVGDIEGQGARVGVDHNLGLTEGTGRLFGESEQSAAMASPLEIAADADEAKTCLLLADQIDAHAHRTDDLAVVDQQMGKVPRREFGRVARVIGLVRQQGSEDRIAANGVIGAPFARRSHGPEMIALDSGGHLRVSSLLRDCQLKAPSVEAQRIIPSITPGHNMLEEKPAPAYPITLRHEEGAVRADFAEGVAQAIAAGDSAALRASFGDLHQADVGEFIEALDEELRP